MPSIEMTVSSFLHFLTDAQWPEYFKHVYISVTCNLELNITRYSSVNYSVTCLAHILIILTVLTVTVCG